MGDVSGRSVKIPAGPVILEGDLKIPEKAAGVILFAHGSGSSRLSPRNRFVAESLNERRFATLLMDLLTREEERMDARTAHLRFDIPVLAGRLEAAAKWLAGDPDTRILRVGYFGASTGAAAALMAAADRPESTGAVVSRGGRPDLAGGALSLVRAPVLLIVGGADTAVIRMNRSALMELHAQAELQIIENASHLFEEPGALEEVARLAGEWFQRYLIRGAEA